MSDSDVRVRCPHSLLFDWGDDKSYPIAGRGRRGEGIGWGEWGEVGRPIHVGRPIIDERSVLSFMKADFKVERVFFSRR